MAKQITFGMMRACQLPAESPDESDELRSLRLNVASLHPNHLRAACSDAYAALVAQLTPTESPNSPTASPSSPNSPTGRVARATGGEGSPS